MFDSPEAQFAIDAVREASLLARRIQREMVGGGTHEGRPLAGHGGRLRGSSPHRPATGGAAAGLDAHRRRTGRRAAAGRRRRDARPDDRTSCGTAIPDATPEEVCGLIDRGSGEPPRTFWTLDPIDGTKGFLRREQYAVALALVRDGKVELGVLGCPELNRRIDRSSSPLAAKARGRSRSTATAIGSNCKVSSRRDAEGRPHPALGRKVSHERRRNRPARREARRHRAARRHGQPGEIRRARRRRRRCAAPTDLAVAARLSRKNLGPGGRLDRRRRSGRPDHRPRRQAARFLARPHAREKPRHPGHQRPSARRCSRRACEQSAPEPHTASTHAIADCRRRHNRDTIQGYPRSSNGPRNWRVYNQLGRGFDLTPDAHVGQASA